MNLSKLLKKVESGKVSPEEARKVADELFLRNLERCLCPPWWKTLLPKLGNILYYLPFYLWEVIIYPVVRVIRELRGE